ncbi:MAG: hypothetical protein NW218_04555 [Saprospiraceae bacterium]|nr:hypothetical protein [Saprospiraceae bacterium]
MYPKNGNVLIFNFPGIFNIFTGSLQVSQDWNGGGAVSGKTLIDFFTDSNACTSEAF